MATHIRERVYIYASLTPGDEVESARVRARPGTLPTGVLVGTVEIVDCTGVPGDYEWHLAKPKRPARKLVPKNHPQPAWFFPFMR